MANNTYQVISSTTVGSGGAANIEFTSIPQTYTDLLIKTSARTDRSGTSGDAIYLIFNSSTSAEYLSMTLRGDGSSATSFNDSSAVTAGAYNTRTDSAGNTSSTFSNNEIYIPNYTSSNYKSMSSDGVTESNATTVYDEINAAIWQNVSAITSIKIVPGVGAFVQYTTAVLYGISKV